MSGVTVFFVEGEREFTDTIDCIYKTVVDAMGGLSVTESLRLIPGTDGNFKSARTCVIYPAGQWREVEFDYDNEPVYVKTLKFKNDNCRQMDTCVCGECEWR